MPNALIIGSDKEPILELLPDRFLFIDDGPLIDRIQLPSRRAVTHFDPQRHSFNPLKDMSYLKARQFWDVLKAVFPEGENTLTKAAAELQILNALNNRPRRLAALIPDTKDTQYAHQLIAKLLLSPVLSNVLCRSTNLSFKGTILARLDRAILGDFDAFVIANLLISQYSGTVVIPDLGFYQCAFHSALLRQNRMIAGINSFDEVPNFKQRLLLVDNKLANHCTPDDAKLLAIYAGIQPGTNKYNAFIEESIA